MWTWLLCLLLSCTIQGSPCPSNNRRVIYLDYKMMNWNNMTQTIVPMIDASYNVIILAFYLTGAKTPADAVTFWVQSTVEERQRMLNYIHKNDACLLFSAGGSTDNPLSVANATALGVELGNFALQYGFDGVDLDVEGIAPHFPGRTVQWLVNASKAIKAISNRQLVVTHAPQAPYFGIVGSASDWAGVSGGYMAVEHQAGNEVDWYNIQFYNQGTECYTSYQGLFFTSCSNFPDTSVQSILNAGLPGSKLVIGKPVLVADATNGYMEPVDIGRSMRNATKAGLRFGGYFGWQWCNGGTAAHWPTHIGNVSQSGGSQESTGSPSPTPAPTVRPPNPPSPSPSPTVPKTPAPSTNTSQTAVKLSCICTSL